MTRLMDQDEHTGPINIGNPTEFTMLELAKVCAPASNCPTMPAEPRPPQTVALRHMQERNVTAVIWSPRKQVCYADCCRHVAGSS